MYNNLNEDVAALIPAAGLGTRLGLGPKAFLTIGGISLVNLILNTLSDYVGRILVGVPFGYFDKAVSEFGGSAEVYTGGSSRQATIHTLLQKCSEQIILIHDGNRPFASAALVQKVINAARVHGAAVAFTPALTPFVHYEDGFVTSPVPSHRAVAIQSPQAFHRDILERGYQNALKNGIEDQTTWELILRLGVKVFAVEGEETNIKITSPLDWEIANKVIAPLLQEKER